MRGQDGVVGLDNGGGNLRGGIDTELKLALLAVIDREALHEKGTKARAGSTTERVKDEETLETGAVVGNATDFVEHLINELFADGVMTASIIVGRVLLSGDHLLRVEEATVCAGADLVDHIGLEIAVDCARDIFALTLTRCQL